MTVTTLDTEQPPPVLGDMVVDQVRFTTAALAGVMDGGNGDDPDLVAWLTAGRSYAELHAMVLLLADCADRAKVTQACGVNPGLAAGNARRSCEAHWQALEYAWLRGGGVIPESAAERAGVKSATRAAVYEQAYQAQRGEAA